MSHVAAWIHTPFAQALGWTLVHFIWEGAALAAAMLAVLWVLREAPARRRYALACLILTAMPVAFAVTLAVLWERQPAAIAAPVYWAPVALSTEPMYIPPPRFSWAGMLDRLAWLVPLWFAGVAFFYARGAAAWVAVQRMRRRGVCAPPTEWQARLNELARRLGISRPVALLESCFTDTPVLIGYLRPVILLPLGCLTGLSVAQVECILLHELAHVTRHDYVVNLLQSLAEGLLFYHPAVWWVSSVVRAERENCCDDRVVELMGNARAYAATLAVLEQRRALVLEAALAATGGNLIQRIRRLTRESRGSQTSVAPAFSAALLLVVFAAALTALPAKLPLRHVHPRTPAPLPLAGFAVAAATPQEPAAELSTPYRKWLTEDVVYIISDQERAAFLKLTTDAEREQFIEQFWQQRNPIPGSVDNEYRKEHYRRIAYTNEHFAGSIAGWKTDRGRTYIVYGPPDEIDDHSSGGNYQRPPEQGGGEVETYPFQQWRYRYIQGVGTNVTMEFVDRFGTGDYPQSTDPWAKEKTPFAKWLAEDVAYIVNPAERVEFEKLTANQERDNFIAQFWQRRGLAAKEEHYRRIAYANEHFHVNGSAAPGWATDLGRTYIVYGPPDGQQTLVAGVIGWTYRNVDGASASFLFRDQGNGDYRLTSGPTAAEKPAQGQDARVFASNEPAAVSVIVPRTGQPAIPDTIGVGDVLDVELATPSMIVSQINLLAAISAKRADCAALARRYQPNYPDLVTCNAQVRSLEERRGEPMTLDAALQLSQLRSDENSIRMRITASVTQSAILEKQLTNSTEALKEMQDKIKGSPAIIQKFNQLQTDLQVAKDQYVKLANSPGGDSHLDAVEPSERQRKVVRDAQRTMEVKQQALATFIAGNQGRLPEDFQANMMEVQNIQQGIARLDQQISQEKQRQRLLESDLNNNKNLQSQVQQNLGVPARRLESSVTVNSDGKISITGRDFAAAGMTPAQLATAIGGGSSVRIEQSAARTVTVLVPLTASRDRFRIFGEVTANQKVVVPFESDATGQPALAKTITLRPGSYHLVVVVKNMASGEFHNSSLDFTVE